MEKLIKERIKENERLFNKEELTFINENIKTINKIYLLGILDKSVSKSVSYII